MAKINLENLMQGLKNVNELLKNSNGIAKYKFDIYRIRGKFELRLNGNCVLSSLTANGINDCLMACKNVLQIAKNS